MQSQEEKKDKEKEEDASNVAEEMKRPSTVSLSSDED
jgi:hypothetical protein